MGDKPAKNYSLYAVANHYGTLTHGHCKLVGSVCSTGRRVGLVQFALIGVGLTQLALAGVGGAGTLCADRDVDTGE